MVVRLPAGLSEDEERYWVDKLTSKVRGQKLTNNGDLAERARRLSAKYRLAQASSISFVTNQATRWGSCTPSTGRIRLSSRLANMPDWVVDYVIVHELSHLTEPGHGRAFWALASRYPLSERARGYLMAIGAGADLDSSDDSDPLPDDD